MRQHHPDRGGDRQRFEEAQAAYEVLSDAGRRRQVDEGSFDFDAFVDRLRAQLRERLPEVSQLLDDVQAVRGRGQASVHERSDAAGRLIFRGVQLFARLRGNSDD